MTIHDQYKNRTWVIRGPIAGIFLLFMIRLLVLQVINKDYAELAKDRDRQEGYRVSRSRTDV